MVQAATDEYDEWAVDNKGTTECIRAMLVKALKATPPAQPAPVQPVALHAMAKRRIFDAIRGAYDLGYNDARSARAVHGDSLLGYKGRNVEADHGGALISALERYTTPPAAAVQEGRDWSLLEATQESLREHIAEIKRLKSAQPAVPDAVGPNEDELPAYAAGWNDCRQAMMEMMK
jgi:hypothetical protein